MHLKTIGLFTAILVLYALPATAQISENAVEAENADRLQLQKNGMMVLASWAVTNMAVSGYMMTRTSQTAFRFHQMNVFWNVVNAGIAASGYWGAAQAGPASFSALETLSEYHNFSKVLLINTGLDAAYVMTGMYLRERARNKPKYQHMLKGYGNSLLLQGGFLLAFDLALVLINETQMQQIPWLEQLQLQASAGGFALTWRF